MSIRVSRAVLILPVVGIVTLIALPLAWFAPTDEPAGVVAPAAEVVALIPQGPPSVDEADVAFRWTANQLSNFGLSRYIEAAGGDERWDIAAANHAVTLQVFDALQDSIERGETWVDFQREIASIRAPEFVSQDLRIADAHQDFEGRAQNAFDLASAHYRAKTDSAEYGRLARLLDEAAHALKSSLHNSPDRVWAVVVEECAGLAYPGWPVDEEQTGYHNRILMPSLCSNPAPQLAGLTLASFSLGGSLQGGKFGCPPGWCPHRGGCVPCDQ